MTEVTRQQSPADP